MLEVNLVADLLIAMREGIKAKKQIKRYYDQYEIKYEDNADKILEAKTRFDKVVETIALLYPEGLINTEFSRQHLYYSIFTAVAHRIMGYRAKAARASLIGDAEIETARNKLDRVGELFEADNKIWTRLGKKSSNSSRIAAVPQPTKR